MDNSRKTLHKENSFSLMVNSLYRNKFILVLKKVRPFYLFIRGASVHTFIHFTVVKI